MNGMKSVIYLLPNGLESEPQSLDVEIGPFAEEFGHDKTIDLLTKGYACGEDCGGIWAAKLSEREAA